MEQESELERAEQGVRNLVQDYRKVAKQRDEHPEVPKILGEGQKLSWRLIDITRLVIMVGVSVGVIYIVLWVLLKLMPWS